MADACQLGAAKGHQSSGQNHRADRGGLLPTLQYPFATSLLEDGDYRRTIHEFLRHQDVKIWQRAGWQMAYTLSVRWRRTWEFAV
jgi:hypothetical protein